MALSVLLPIVFALLGISILIASIVYWIRTRPAGKTNLFVAQNTIIGGYIHTPSPKPVQLSGLFDPMRSATIQDIVGGAQDLESLIVIDKAHEEVYRKVLADKQLIEQLRASQKKENAQQILRDWLKRQDLYSQKKIAELATQTQPGATPAANTVTPTEPSTPSEKKLLKKDAKKKLDETAQKQLESASTNAVGNQPLKLSGEVGKNIKSITSTLDEENILKFIEVITGLPFNIMQLIITHYTTEPENDNQNENIVKQVFHGATTKDMVISNMKEEVIKILQSRYESMKEQISSLRKKGVDMKNEGINIMKVPLKIKVFSATFAKEDYQRVMEILLEVKDEVEKKKALLKDDKK